MIDYDSIVERASRRLAKTVSRRSVLRTLGTLLVGASSMPLLPVARGQSGVKDKGDQAACDYWRYCAIDASRALRRFGHDVPAGDGARTDHPGRHLP